MSDASYPTDSLNRAILDEINAISGWFHARKVHPIWARQVDVDQTVETLEGHEKVAAGDFLCRGAAGELWPQTAASLAKKYDPSHEVDPDGWRVSSPRWMTGLPR